MPLLLNWCRGISLDGLIIIDQFDKIFVRVPTRCRLNVGSVPTRCRLNVGTVPMRCRLNVGTVPTFKLSQRKMVKDVKI